MKFLSSLVFLFFSAGLFLNTNALAVSLDENLQKEGVSEVKIAITPLENMVHIPAGYFTFGSDDYTDEESPAQEIYIDGFFIDKYEVRNSEYEKFLKATGSKNPKYWDDPRFNAPDQPVVGVTWYDADAYSKWVGKRLPSETEWEKAARGTKENKWPWGNELTDSYKFNYLNIYGTQDNYEYTAPVDYYKLGVSPYGVFNMAGNVLEWCSDWYDKEKYKKQAIVNPKGSLEGIMKVLRGGSWVNSIEEVRVTKRGRNYPDVALDIYGFRCALSVK